MSYHDSKLTHEQKKKLDQIRKAYSERRRAECKDSCIQDLFDDVEEQNKQSRALAKLLNKTSEQ